MVLGCVILPVYWEVVEEQCLYLGHRNWHVYLECQVAFEFTYLKAEQFSVLLKSEKKRLPLKPWDLTKYSPDGESADVCTLMFSGGNKEESGISQEI